MKKLTITFNRASLNKGETFEVRLPGLQDDNIRWAIDLPAGKVTLVGDRNIPETPGVSQAKVYTLRADDAGIHTLTATLKNPAMKKNKTPYQVVFKINVK